MRAFGLTLNAHGMYAKCIAERGLDEAGRQYWCGLCQILTFRKGLKISAKTSEAAKK